jgi:hypothetical protein
MPTTAGVFDESAPKRTIAAKPARRHEVRSVVHAANLRSAPENRLRGS